MKFSGSGLDNERRIIAALKTFRIRDLMIEV